MFQLKNTFENDGDTKVMLMEILKAKQLVNWLTKSELVGLRARSTLL